MTSFASWRDVILDEKLLNLHFLHINDINASVMFQYRFRPSASLFGRVNQLYVLATICNSWSSAVMKNSCPQFTGSFPNRKVS